MSADPLLLRVVADPGDAALAVWADALEERGETAAASLVRGSEDPAVMGAWRSGLEPDLREVVDERAFAHGLPGFLHSKTGRFLQRAMRAKVFRLVQGFGLDCVILRGPTKRPEAVAEAWPTGLCRSLRWFDCQLDDRGLARMSRNPSWQGLQRLTLEKVRAGDAGLEALGGAGLDTLHTLELPAPVHGGAFTTAGVLTAMEGLPALTSLEVGDAYRFRFDVFAAAGERLGRLLHLSIETDESLGALAACPHLTNLESLTFRTYTNRTTEADIRALIENPALHRLQKVSLSGPFSGDLASPALVAELRARFANVHVR